MAELLKTPLHSFHQEAGGQLVEYAGWEMPLRYGSVQEEVRQVRESGGLFDVSHMARFGFKGRHARRLLERLCSRRIGDMQQGQARYTLICNERGGVKDDALVYRMDDDDFVMVANAGNRAKLVEHFESVRAENDWKVNFEDRTEKTAMIAAQGPKVMDLVAGVSSEVPTLKKYRFAVKNLMVVKLIVSRTGYTGEDGVEVILPGSMVSTAMKLLLKDVDLRDPNAMVRPIGLAARDVLRLEAGMPLYGHELGEDIDALACGIDFAISFDKEERNLGERFIGQDALEQTREAGGPPMQLVGLKLEGPRTPRQGMPVQASRSSVGEVTSGCASPTLGHPIAMAFVGREHAEIGTSLEVDAGRAMLAAEVVPLPFYKLSK
ncbi:MAG: glycine cleavage system aminomethyltransferase GcvT [Planctomycetota bacterium]